jgi:hypothetical protein
MAQPQPLLNLIDDLTGDIRDPSLLWQLVAIVGAVILGFALARLLKKRFGRDEAHGGMLRFGVESFWPWSACWRWRAWRWSSTTSTST